VQKKTTLFRVNQKRTKIKKFGREDEKNEKKYFEKKNKKKYFFLFLKIKFFGESPFFLKKVFRQKQKTKF
jgi:hypothetical protein